MCVCVCVNPKDKESGYSKENYERNKEGLIAQMNIPTCHEKVGAHVQGPNGLDLKAKGKWCFSTYKNIPFSV